MAAIAAKASTMALRIMRPCFSSSPQPLAQRPLQAARRLPVAANHRLGGQLRVIAPAQEFAKKHEAGELGSKRGADRAAGRRSAASAEPGREIIKKNQRSFNKELMRIHGRFRVAGVR